APGRRFHFLARHLERRRDAVEAAREAEERAVAGGADAIDDAADAAIERAVGRRRSAIQTRHRSRVACLDNFYRAVRHLFFTGGGAPPPPRSDADTEPRIRSPRLGVAAGAAVSYSTILFRGYSTIPCARADFSLGMR